MKHLLEDTSKTEYENTKQAYQNYLILHIKIIFMIWYFKSIQMQECVGIQIWVPAQMVLINFISVMWLASLDTIIIILITLYLSCSCSSTCYKFFNSLTSLNNTMRMISSFEKRSNLAMAQGSYTVGEKELLGIVEGLKAFSGVIRG